MLNYLLKSGVDIESELASKKGRIVMEIPFDSKRKRQTTAVRLEGGGVRLFVKGATEAIVVLCSQTLMGGNSEEFTAEMKDTILGPNGILKTFARKCYRCLCVSYRDFTAAEWEALSQANNDFKNFDEINTDELESNLTMTCIFGLMDPLRPGIKDAIE